MNILEIIEIIQWKQTYTNDSNSSCKDYYLFNFPNALVYISILEFY